MDSIFKQINKTKHHQKELKAKVDDIDNMYERLKQFVEGFVLKTGHTLEI